MSNVVDNGRNSVRQMIPYVKGKDEQGRSIILSINTGTFTRTDANVEAPRKEDGYISQVSHDLTFVGRTDGREEDVFGKINEFTISMSIRPPDGFYYEILSRPNLLRAGYEIAGGTFILDPNNQDEVIIPLKKFVDGEDLQLPFIGARLVARPLIYVGINEIVEHTETFNRQEFINQPQNTGRRGFVPVSQKTRKPQKSYGAHDYGEGSYSAPPIPGRNGGGRAFQPDFGGDDGGRPSASGRGNRGRSGGRSGRSNMF